MPRVSVVICVCIFIGVTLDNGAEGLIVKHPSDTFISAKPGRKCMNLIFTEPCPNHCNISLKVTLERNTAYVSAKHTISVPSKNIMNFNAAYLLCMFDPGAGENITCCKDISYKSSVNVTTGVQLDFRDQQKISFDLEACNQTCVTLKNFFKAVLPWNDPCYLGNPCQNFGKCQPAYNSYTCSCLSNWNGTNCTIPSDMTYHTGQCLDYVSNGDVKLYMKTVGHCRRECLYKGSSECKAFEFKPMVSGNQGNCTLRNSNSLEQKLKSCDMDLYEFTKLLTPPTPGSHSAHNVVAAAITSYLLLASLTSLFM